MKHDKPPTHYFQILSRLKSRDFKEWEFNPRDVAELAALVLPRVKAPAATSPHGQEQSLQETCKSAVRTALEIIRQTVDVVNLEIDPSEPRQAEQRRFQEWHKQQVERLNREIIEPLKTQERRRKNLPDNSEIKQVSLDSYLSAVMGKTRDGPDGRRHRYAEFMLQREVKRLRKDRSNDDEEMSDAELPTMADALSWVRDTISTETIFWIHDDLVEFHAGYAPKRRKDAGRAGGIASAAARKTKAQSRTPAARRKKHPRK
jgi:hypothetical protein